MLRKSEDTTPLISQKGHQVGKGCHVGELKKRPAPAVGFAKNNSDGTEALQGINKKHHQAQTHQWRTKALDLINTKYFIKM